MAGIINNKVVFTPIAKAIVGHKEVDEDDFRIAKILST
jgi:6-phosphofructokinase 1